MRSGSSAFRHNLREAMRSHHLTHDQISRRAGYNVTYVRKVLAGRYNPTLLFAECMAFAVDKSLIDLLTEEEHEPS